MTCIASKAYYGAFHRAKQIMDQRWPGWDCYGRNHTRLVAAFSRVAEPHPLFPQSHSNSHQQVGQTLRTNGKLLYGAHHLRVMADYKIDVIFSHKDAEVAQLKAKSILALVDELVDSKGTTLPIVNDLLCNPLHVYS